MMVRQSASDANADRSLRRSVRRGYRDAKHAVSLSRLFGAAPSPPDGQIPQTEDTGGGDWLREALEQATTPHQPEGSTP
jgi:hypothetical protein